MNGCLDAIVPEKLLNADIVTGKTGVGEANE
jgi:hypothetical protein